MGGRKSLGKNRMVPSVLAAGLLTLGLARAATPDDPALARVLGQPATIGASSEPAADESFPRWRIGLGFGWASPVVDPDLREGFGGNVHLAFGQRVALELRIGGAYNKYEPPLDNLGVPFASGDITVGPGIPLLLRRQGRIDLFAGVGPAWMVSWLGTTWSIGTVAGIGGELRVNPWFGLRLEAAYHLFHLAEIGGPKFYDRKSLREVGPVDRFELLLGPVFRL